MFYAHTLADRSPPYWETMAEHEDATAIRCADFLKRIHPDLEDWGELLGRWHDLGKYSDKFQQYIRRAGSDEPCAETKPGRVDHSTAGAQHAANQLPKGIGDLIAYVIAGHHAGLADAFSLTGQKKSGLRDRLKRSIEDYKSNAPKQLLQPPQLSVPKEVFSCETREHCGFRLSFLCRILFSALCDSDFLATEAFMSPSEAKTREENLFPTVSALSSCLDKHLKTLTTLSSKTSSVNECRAEVLRAANDAAQQKPGAFSLTVPTGGGKTLSSLAFALKHAELYKMPRVIYTIPFTSVIEQTADVFRSVFQDLSPESVLEHHSNLDPEQESQISRLATQNWDAPIVVTTNVQFFESLFAARTSQCRKLHRIAGSVIIFDEVQTLPVKYIKPCLAAIRELVEMYRCTVLFCTATQPALSFSDEFPIGLRNVREIIADPEDLYHRMQRVHIENLGTQSDDQIADRILENRQILCIVNTRPHALALFEKVSSQSPENEVFHLSTNMCAAHRKRELTKIRKRVAASKPCRVISTQLIEAGVDIDFPIVYRALSGLDSVAQAAGRCNREGKLKRGQVFLFEPEGRKLTGYLKAIAQTAKEVMQMHDDILSLRAIKQYFRLHFWNQKSQWDAHAIVPMFADAEKLNFQFRTAAYEFRLIDDHSRSVFIPWSKSGKRIERKLRSRAFRENPRFRRQVLREIQMYTVPVFESNYHTLVGSDVELIDDRIAVLINTDMYEQKTGLNLARTGEHDPESIIV